MLVLVVLLVAAVGVRTEAGRGWVARQLETRLDPPNGRIHLGDLRTDLFSGATLFDVTLYDAADRPLVHLNRVDARWRLGSLPGLLVISELHVVGAYVILTEGADGLDIAAVWDDGSPPSGARWTGIGFDLRADDVTLEGLSVRYVRPDRAWGVDGARLHAEVALEGPAVIVRDLTLDAATTWPELGALALGGGLRWDPATLWTDGLALTLGPNHLAVGGGLGRLEGDPTVGLSVSAAHVEPASLVALVGALPVTGAFDAVGAVTGPLAAPSLTLDVVTPGGLVKLAGAFDGRGERPSWTAAITPMAVGLDTFLPLGVPVVVSGTVTAQGQGVRWPDDLEATVLFALEAPRVDTLTDLAARGTLTLTRGMVTVADLAATGLGGGVRGAGEVRILDERGELRIRSADLPLASLARFGVAGLRGTAHAVGLGRFGWGDGLGGSFDGTIGGTGVGYGEAATVATLSGPVTARWSPAEGAWIEADLVGDTFAAPPATATKVAMRGTATVGPDGSLVVDTTASVDGVAVEGLSAERAVLELDLTRTPAGRLDGEAVVETGRVAWEGWESDHGTARVRLQGAVADVTLDLLEGARTMVGFDGQLDLDARSMRARRVVVAPTEELAWRSEGIQTLRLVPGGVEDVRLLLESGHAWISADGRGRRKDLVNIRVEAHEVRLGWLAELLPGRFAGYAGTVSARASMEGHAKKPTMYLDLDARDLTIPDLVRGLDLTLTGADEDCELHVEGRLATAGQTLATFSGDAPFSLAIDAPGFKREGDLDLRLRVAPTDAARVQEVLPKIELPTFRASAEVALTGPVLDPELRVVVSGTAPLGSRGEWVAFDLDAGTADGVLSLRGSARERLERRALLDGRIDLALGEAWRWLIAVEPDRPAAPDPRDWVGRLDVNLVPTRFGVQALAQFTTAIPASLRGEISGGVHLGGTARKPLLEGALFLQDGRIGELPLSPAVVSVRPATGGFDVEGLLGFGAEGGVSINGFAPFAPGPEGLLAELDRPGLDLVVTAEAVPLQALAAAVPGMTAAAGTLSAAGTVTGTLRDPYPDVGFGLVGGDFTLDQTGVRYSKVAFTGGVTHDEAHVEALSAQTTRINMPGTGRLEGRFAITRPGTVREVEKRKKGELDTTVVSAVLEHPLVEGELKFHKAVILNLPDKQLQIDGGLRLNERGRKLHAGGRIVVTAGKLVVPERFFTGGTDLELDPDVRVIRSGQAAREKREQARAFAFPDWFDAEVHVVLNHNAFLDATVPLEQVLGELMSSFSSIQASSIQLDGELTVGVDRGALSVVGQVRPERGTTTVLGRAFAIDENAANTISFTGRDYLDPVLNLQARYHPPAGDYGDILALITGTPSTIDIQLEPESTSLAKEDVLPVLLTGRPLNELDAGEQAGIGSTLLSYFGGVFKSQVTNAGSRALDVFEFDATGNLRVGRRLGDKVFLIATVNLVDPDPTTTENTVEATVEWQLGRKWRLDLTTGTEGISSATLDRRWRF